MSEFSAGVWQPKRTYAEKSYIETDNPSLAFTFRAFADAQSNFQLEIYLNVHWVSNDTWSGVLVSSGALAMPDLPLATYSENSFPAAATVDLSQEPSYALVTQKSQFPNSLTTAPNYSSRGQTYITTAPLRPRSIRCRVPALTGSQTAPVALTLLNTIDSQRVVIPLQDRTFASEDPFFAGDPARTFFVYPHYYTASSSPQELDNLAYIPQWTTSYTFTPFYHPYAAPSCANWKSAAPTG